MILWDVNLWVHAFRSDSPSHELARAELDATFVTADRRFERFQGLTCRYLQA